MNIEPIQVGGKTIEHNAVQWRVCTNRHPETSGREWGWIEGSPGDITWSNNHDTGFNRLAAEKAVQMHNQWLEEQKPLAIKLIEQREKVKRLSAEYDKAKAAFDYVREQFVAETEKLNALSESKS